MSKVTPRTLSGFMELLPNEQKAFNHMKDIIEKNYKSFGFLPIDTPNIESSEILLAKGGGETEAQMYRFTKGTTDMALRFDLTVPLARYVAQHFSDLEFPFKRYHIGKVYRGERSQRGRFREFYQCDIDIIGHNKLDIKNDAEIPFIIYSIFKELDFGKFTIEINNRKLLTGFFESLNITDTTGVLRALDKTDKIGIEKVNKELKELGLSDEKIDEINKFTSINGTNEEILDSLKKMNIENETFKLGLEELKTIYKYGLIYGIKEDYIKINILIARGLDYYTGTVYETFLDEHPEIGSVCSGGRYDDLASHYTTQKLPGVGISIGLTRLFDQLNYLDLIKYEDKGPVNLLIIPMAGLEEYGVELSAKLRAEGISSQVHYEKAKMGRKFGYADKLNIPKVIVIGQNEVDAGVYSLRDMITGQQEELNFEELVKNIKDS